MTVQKSKILIVDHIIANVKAIRFLLADSHLEILEASSGKDALELVMVHEFALILMDVQMPDMDGFEIASRIWELKKSNPIPLIFLTADSTGLEQITRGYEVGAVDYMTKPLEPIVLKSKVYNILELQKQKLELKEYAQRLEAANQNLERFAATVSHDLKAPLRAVDHLSRFIAEDLTLCLKNNSMDEIATQTLENLNLMTKRVVRMKRMIDDILNYARADKANLAPEELDTRVLFAEIADLLNEHNKFRIRISPDLPVFETVRSPLSQVISNLIDNAMKHHDSGEGTIDISVDEEEHFYVFYVSDDGPGIAEKDQEKVFEMLQTLSPKDQTDSTGIGLALVKKLVENAGGAIALSSSEGEGCSFQIKWPKVWSSAKKTLLQSQT